MATNPERYMEQPLPFGAWLVQQKDRGGLIGQLAAGAAADRRFPKSGDVGQVRAHLSAMQADGDMHAAIDKPAAEVVAFPREGFIIGDHLCRASGPQRHLACFAEREHDGEHQWGDWRGCRVRVPGWGTTVPFMGFAE